jgi:hypothetical protein
MAPKPAFRKLALTAHVASSVGWLGAVGTSLVLAVAGLVKEDPQTVRGAYLNLELVGWYALVPLSFASLLTGLVSSLGTTWGLFRHYWVLAKLVINVFATIVLLMYMQSLGYLARVAAQTSSSGDLSGLRSSSPVLHAGAALLLLLVATVLGVYKPRGVTPYGWRKQQERHAVLVL